MALVTLVRHGQASFGAEDYDQLSELGAEQAKRLGEFVMNNEEPIECLIHGTLKRHQQSVNAFLGALPYEPICVDDACWNEFDHRAVIRVYVHENPSSLADVLSKEPERVLPVFMKAVERWQARPTDNEYPEPWAHFAERIEQAWVHLNDVVKNYDRVWVVTSGGPIACSVINTLQMPLAHLMTLNARLVNTSLTRFLFRRDQRELLTLNEHSHVSGKYQRMLTYR